MSKQLMVFLVLAFLPAADASAEAAVKLFSQRDRLLCESDIRALCPLSRVSRRDEFQYCLLDQADYVRDSDCKAIVDSAKAQVAGILQTCRFDIDTKCTGLDVGSGVLECLVSRREELMGSCRKAI